MTDPHARSPANFDRLAGWYRALEFLAFGRDLERTRFALIEQLRDCRSILILGEGDGRFLARLLALAPEVHVDCVDSSARMLERAAARLGSADRGRVTFTQADAQALDLPPGAYDAAVTVFFLDCFEADAVGRIVRGVSASLRPGARWLFADFVEPARGLARWRARVWLAGLYAFFRWQTGLRVTALPPSDAIIARAGFTPVQQREYQHGMLRTVLFRRD